MKVPALRYIYSYLEIGEENLQKFNLLHDTKVSLLCKSFRHVELQEFTKELLYSTLMDSAIGNLLIEQVWMQKKCWKHKVEVLRNVSTNFCFQSFKVYWKFSVFLKQIIQKL